MKMPSRANASSRMSVGRRRRTDNQEEEESNKGGDAAVVLGGGSCNDEGGQEGSEGVHTFSVAPKSLVPKNPRKRRRTRGLDPNEVASEQCDGVFEGSAASQGNLLGRTSLPSSDKLEEGVKANPTDGIQNGDSTAEVRDVASLPRHKSDSRNLQDATASDPTSPPAATRRTSLRNRRCSALLTRVGLSNDADADDDDDDDGVHAEHDEKDDVDDGRGEGKEECLEKDAKSSRRRAPNPKRDKQAICPHCHKEFSSAEGLNYHLARWVCRKADCPDPAIVEQGNRKRGRGKAYSTSGGSAKKKWEKFRGPEEERICPRCKRVFTSILGLQYHLSKYRCFKRKTNVPFLLLFSALIDDTAGSRLCDTHISFYYVMQFRKERLPTRSQSDRVVWSIVSRCDSSDASVASWRTLCDCVRCGRSNQGW